MSPYHFIAGALAYGFVRKLAAFYVVAGLFGFIYAGVMPFYSVPAASIFRLQNGYESA
ncbi:hypothetical protein [Bradyrhizobium erythrophlei]|uniref:hypothetical protein n=1 Tax=Bradyrhizobium erythrophlei TaxID=1437360 RepID=UPI0012AB4B7D|nr:hypothetical protein [Bradyrhizobium erythrophlei]